MIALIRITRPQFADGYQISDSAGTHTHALDGSPIAATEYYAIEWDVVAPAWYTAPSEPEPAPVAVEVPQEVTMRQARLALFAAGLLPTVDAAVAQIGGAAAIEWEYSGTVRRDYGLVAQLGPLLGMDDAALDALFIAAGGL